MRRSARLVCMSGVGAVAVLAMAYTPAQGAEPLKGTALQIIKKGVTSSASVNIPGLSPAELRLMAAQQAVDKVADRIEAASKDRGTSGISGVIVDPAHNAVNLYWHGKVSQAAGREIAKAADKGVRVTVIAAPYRLSQLVTETNRLAAVSLTESKTANPRIVSVAAAPDGSGLDVGVANVTSKVTPAVAHELIPALSSAIHYTVEAASIPEPANREADTPPYWGGAQISNVSGDCSSGFGVTGNNGAATYILTARHCGTGTWTTGDGTHMGSTIPTFDWTHDAELILTTAGSSVYDGGAIGAGNQFSKSVTGSSASHDGDHICTSGAYSGADCGIVVKKINEALTVEGHSMKLVRAERTSHAAAIGNGDSGGPVFSLANSNTTDVARGTITAYDANNEVACQGVPAGGGRSCSWRFWYGDITLQASAIGFHVNVS